MTWLGRYELVEPLGHGAMGEIWRARDSMLDREVAVKVVTRRTDDPLDDERLLREAHAAARVSHQNVVALYDIGRSEGRPFLVMELVEGCTLSVLLKSGPLPYETIRSILVQTLAGLRAAHAQGVVHRDVKPANIMVDPDGVVKIVDFGLADDGWGARITRQGSFMGTAAYAAPERIQGRAFDIAADLYSLGCVLYEMLTGRAPFEGDILAQTYAHVHQCPEPPSRLRRSVPPDLDAFAIALLAKDPDLRPDSLEDFDPTLVGMLPAARWRLRGVRQKALVGALATVAAAGLLLAFQPGVREEPRSGERTDREAPSSGPSNDPYTVPGWGSPPLQVNARGGDGTPGPQVHVHTHPPTAAGTPTTPAVPSASPGGGASTRPAPEPEPEPTGEATTEPKPKKRNPEPVPNPKPKLKPRTP